MERATRRPHTLPAKFSDEEIDELKRRAAAAGFKTISRYVRHKLDLADVPKGRPVGSPNRKKKEG